MEELNELITSMFLDVGVEGVGTAAGIGLLWGCFMGGVFVLFRTLLEILAGTI